MPPSIEQFDSRHFAKVLSESREAILSVWKSRAKEQIRAARALDMLTLEDGLPYMLDDLSRLLMRLDDEPSLDPASAALAREHGRQRYRLAIYDIAAVVREYGILRKTVFDALGRSQGSFPLRIVDAINGFFDLAMVEAGDAFIARVERDYTSELVKERANHMATLQDERLDAQRREAMMRRENKATRDANSVSRAALEQSKTDVKRLGDTLAARDQYVSFLSHDLRSPLSAVLLSAQMLARRLAQGPHEDLVLRIVKATLKADQLVEDFLGRRQVDDAHPWVSTSDACDLSDVLRQLEGDLAERHEGRFVFSGPDSLQGFWDRRAVERAIGNLCDNAIKYGDPQRNVHVSWDVDKDDHVHVAVKNFGKAIPQADQRRIFERSFRTQEAKESSQPGWGLGLAYVFAVAKAHGGRVAVHSSEEHGTTFQLVIPRDSQLRETTG